MDRKSAWNGERRHSAKPVDDQLWASSFLSFPVPSLSLSISLYPPLSLSLCHSLSLSRPLFSPRFQSVSQRHPPHPTKKNNKQKSYYNSQTQTKKSGFSSPHSGSSLSIPFPNVLPELQGRSSVGPPSPLPGELQRLYTGNALVPNPGPWVVPPIMHILFPLL